MIRLFLLVEDVTAVMAAGYTVIRVYTDTSATGTFATLDGTATLVAGQESYEYTDLQGTDDTWYKSAYYGAVPGESDKSAARKGETSSAYGTVKELRAHMVKAAIAQDWELAQLLDGATRLIDGICNRPEGFVATASSSARLFAGTGGPFQYIDECVSITTVAVKDSATDTTYTAWASTDWVGFAGSPDRPDFQPTAHHKPYTALMVTADGSYSTFTSGQFTTRRGFRPTSTISRAVPTVQVTATWGYAATIPPDIKAACLEQAARWWKRLESAMADTIGSAETGQLLYKQRLDPDIANILINGRYVRPAIG